jgi:crossover junction endodeoxyribonuclease RusA
MDVQAIILADAMKRGIKLGIDGKVKVLIHAWAPTKAAWDVDNRVKPTLDALTHAGVWKDDVQVRRVTIQDKGIFTGGKIIVSIESLEEMLF